MALGLGLSDYSNLTTDQAEVELHSLFFGAAPALVALIDRFAEPLLLTLRPRIIHSRVIDEVRTEGTNNLDKTAKTQRQN